MSRPMLGPLIERIERRLTLLEASERLAGLTVDEMTDALLDVRLGVPGKDGEEQRRFTRYYASRLLERLSGGKVRWSEPIPERSEPQP